MSDDSESGLGMSFPVIRVMRRSCVPCASGKRRSQHRPAARSSPRLTERDFSGDYLASKLEDVTSSHLDDRPFRATFQIRPFGDVHMAGDKGTAAFGFSIRIICEHLPKSFPYGRRTYIGSPRLRAHGCDVHAVFSHV